MRRLLSIVGLALGLWSAGSGCYVQEQPSVAYGPRGCPGGVWIAGHRGPHGRWHPAHWRCPGVVERIEID